MGKYIFGALGALLIAFCFILSHQVNVINTLKAENAAQAKTIELQSESITKLEADIAENERLTFEISKEDNKTREQTNAIIKSIPKADKQSDAFNANAPLSVIDFLRK